MIENNDEVFKPKQENDEPTSKKRFFKKEKKVAEANKFPDDGPKTFWSEFQLPKRWVDVTDPFYFKVYNQKTDGLIFFITTLVVPFLIILLTRFTVYNLSTRSLVNSILYMASALVGFICLLSRDKKLCYSSGMIFYYLPIFTSFGLGFLLALIQYNIKDDTLSNYLTTAVNIIISITWITLMLVYIPNLKIRIKKTLTKNWRMLLLTSFITAVLMFLFSGIIFQLIFQNTPLVGKSANQESLVAGQGIVGAILLIILSVFVAPLYEELIYRHLYFTGIGNKVLGFFASALTFAMIHVLTTGDVEHVLQYFVGAMFLSGIFLMARGNVTYSWFTHMFYNLIGIIIILATNWSW